MVKAIIFDWGNVIEFHNKTKFLSKMSCHFKVDKKLFEEIERKNRLEHDLGKLSTQQFVGNIGRGINRKLTVKGYYALIDRFKVKKLNSFIINLIKKLRKRYNLYLLSNNSRPAHAEIKKYRIDRLFDKVLFSYQLGIKKPNPEFFKSLLDKTGFSYRDCLLIDDREDTCRIARKLGMKTIIFKNNQQLKKKLAHYLNQIKL